MKTTKTIVVTVGVVTVVVVGIIAAVVGVLVSKDCEEQPQQVHSGPFKAVVVLNTGNQVSGVTGVLDLFQELDNKPVRITGTVTGFAPNSSLSRGFHIHQSGDIRNNTCASTLAHYNPHGKRHGGPNMTERHLGDLGNIIVDAAGNAAIDITDNHLTLTGDRSILGRAMVVHELEDDLGKGEGESMNTGNAGGRVACGIIGRIYE